MDVFNLLIEEKHRLNITTIFHLFKNQSITFYTTEAKAIYKKSSELNFESTDFKMNSLNINLLKILR